MTTPTDPPRSDITRVALTQALRGMAVAAALVGLWVLWGFIGGAPKDDRPPSLPISDLAPERFKWSDAPVPPPGVRPEDGARYKLLVLRDAAGTARAFYLPPPTAWPPSPPAAAP